MELLRQNPGSRYLEGGMKQLRKVGRQLLGKLKKERGPDVFNPSDLLARAAQRVAGGEYRD